MVLKMGTESQVLRCSEGAVPQSRFLTSPAANSMPACRSASISSSPSRTLTKEDGKVCTICDRDGESLHRLKQDEAVRNFCSSCILFQNKGMYCSLCYLVYPKSTELGDPAFWLTCTNCQRMCHLECARKRDLCTESVVFTCHYCSKPEKAPAKETCASSIENGSPPSKKLRLMVDQQGTNNSPEEALAAAHIVAFLAVQQAKDAKSRARASAAVAAKAAGRAKAALDTAFRVAQEEARWIPESSRSFPDFLSGKNTLSGPNAPKIRRGDGAASMSYIPCLHPESLSSKERAAKGHRTGGYGLLNAKFTTEYHKLKASPSTSEVNNPVPRTLVALSRGTTFLKPQTVSFQESTEQSEIPGPFVESVSPASRLDAASSLNTPQTGSALVSMPETGAAMVGNSLPMTLAGSGSFGSSSKLFLEKDCSLIVDKGHQIENTSITASCPVKEVMAMDSALKASVPVKENLRRSNSVEVHVFLSDMIGKEIQGGKEKCIADFVDEGELLTEGCTDEKHLVVEEGT